MRELPKDVPLFRGEAIAHRADGLFGGVLLPPPKIIGRLGLASALLTGGLLILLFVGEYPHRARATGWLTTDVGAAKVTSQRMGVVADLRVAEGALVKKGEVLLILSSSRSSSGDTDVDEKLISELRRQSDALDQQVSLERLLNAAERNRLKREIENSRLDIKKSEELKEVTEARLLLAEADLRRARDLAERGLLSRAAVEKVEDVGLTARLATVEAQERLVQKKKALDSESATLANSELHLQKKLAELMADVSSIQQRIAEAEGARDSIIKAPLDGHVTNLVVHPGDTIAAGHPLLSVMPMDAPLQAKLVVPSRAVGFLQPGMNVLLRYDAFPYQRFGQYSGHIRDIARTILSPRELQEITPFQMQEPGYIVTVALDKQEVRAAGNALPLRAGLTLQADVVYDRRTLVEWIFAPLLAATGSI